MIIVDTNVVSELMRREPSPAVLSWLGQQHLSALRITAVTVAEILYGIERLPDGRRKVALSESAHELFSRFADEVIAFDGRAAKLYAEIVDLRERSGTPISGFDAQIASICRVHDAALATRNERDFVGVGLRLINPWST